MDWDAIEPTFADIYRKTFSQHEVDGMMVFHKSDVGHSIIAKMPMAMHETMQAVDDGADTETAAAAAQYRGAVA